MTFTDPTVPAPQRLLLLIEHLIRLIEAHACEAMRPRIFGLRIPFLRLPNPAALFVARLRRMTADLAVIFARPSLTAPKPETPPAKASASIAQPPRPRHRSSQAAPRDNATRATSPVTPDPGQPDDAPPPLPSRTTSRNPAPPHRDTPRLHGRASRKLLWRPPKSKKSCHAAHLHPHVQFVPVI